MGAPAPKVLLAWEHGRNLGHAARLRAVADTLLEAGVEPVWALPSAGLRLAVIARPGETVHCAPALSAAAMAGPPMSYAEILLGLGFAEAPALRDAVRAWHRLFEAVKAEAIVLDYAPTAQLAAHLAALPALQVSNGFDAPPPSCPPFGVRLRGAHVDKVNAERVAELDRCIRSVAKVCDRNASLESFLSHPVRLLDCIPETDPYGPRSDARYVGPLGAPARVEEAAWPYGEEARDRPRVFAYLRNGPLAWETLRSVAKAGAQVLCVWPDADPVRAVGLGPGVRLVRQPVPVAQVLHEADAVVNYGSTAMVCQSLLAGKAQLMLPIDIEKWMVASRVARMGAGVMPADSTRLSDAVQFMLSNNAGGAARQVARRYLHTDWAGEMKDAVTAALGLPPPAR
jgi:UDP:flavonoid glycosyltransferase YjiC (YdhE family)